MSRASGKLALFTLVVSLTSISGGRFSQAIPRQADEFQLPEFSTADRRRTYERDLDEESVRALYLILTSRTSGDFDDGLDKIRGLPPRKRMLVMDELVRLMTSMDPSHRLWATEAVAGILDDGAPEKSGIKVTMKYYTQDTRDSTPGGYLLASIQLPGLDKRIQNLVPPSEYLAINDKITDWWKSKRKKYFAEISESKQKE
jgi:hypothetical protein